MGIALDLKILALHYMPRASLRTGHVSAEIVRSLIDLAHNLELSVVAEGVENEEIMKALAHLNCDFIQGYHLGRAMPGAELTARLRSGTQSTYRRCATGLRQSGISTSSSGPYC
jgi:EAL domain-containing protein (putative c-di-GMP-specific phosphodiesterase class I)